MENAVELGLGVTGKPGLAEVSAMSFPASTVLRLACTAWVAPVLAAAFPLPAQRTIRVPQDKPTIQGAIDAAQDGDTVLVSPGTYAVNLVYENKAITVTSGATSYNSPAALATILTPQDPTVPIVSFQEREGLGSVLNGFTITNSTRSFDGSVTANSYQTPTVTNNRFVGDASPVLLPGGEFAGNYITECTGGFYPVVSVAFVDGDPYPYYVYTHDNLIENNTASGYVLLGSGRTERNIIRNNVSTVPRTLQTGGGILDFVNGEFTQNLVYGNTGYTLLSSYAPLVGHLLTVVANNTFANNVALASCTTACRMTQIQFIKSESFDGNTLLLANNIFQTPSPGPYVTCPDDPPLAPLLPPVQDSLQVDHNLFSPSAAPLYDTNCRPQITNAGNLQADPKFANPGTSDFHLTAGSPAVDAANNSVMAQLAVFGVPLATDFDGNPRPVDATGIGYPVLDMGAYELPGVVDGAPTGLLLTPSDYDPNISQVITFTAALSSSLGVPVGPVTFYEDGTAVATSNVKNDGTTTLALPLNTAGPVEFLATYPGAYPYTPAQSTKLVLVVALYSTYINLTATPSSANPGQPVTLQIITGSYDASFVPSPITLTANGVFLATVYPDANGNASLVTTTLPAGTDTVVATYAGDQHHKPSTASTTVTIVVNDFTIMLNPPTVTVVSGNQVQAGVLLASLGLFADSLHITVANLPQYSSGSLSPATVQLSAGGTASAVLTISTSSLPLHAAAGRLGRLGSSAPVAFAMLTLLPLTLGRRRRVAGLALLALFSCALPGLIGCTDISYPLNKVAPGTYTLPVTATDPATGTSHTANLTLVVTAS